MAAEAGSPRLIPPLERCQAICETRVVQLGCPEGDCDCTEEAQSYWNTVPGCFDALLDALECSLDLGATCGTVCTDGTHDPWTDCALEVPNIAGPYPSDHAGGGGDAGT
jgi:hypothetical protein